MFFITLLLLLLLTQIQSHPVLSTRWISTTKEPGAPGDGVGVEAYKYVDKPTPENPSGIWSNYTGCSRLILIKNNYGAKRYLLGCDAVDCCTVSEPCSETLEFKRSLNCTEEQDGNHVEFQIPNIHSQFRKINVKQDSETINVFGKDVETDTWTWSTLGQNWTAYTSLNENEEPILHRWETGVLDTLDVSIDFKDFTPIKKEEETEFDNLFKVPEVCLLKTVHDCANSVKFEEDNNLVIL